MDNHGLMESRRFPAGLDQAASRVTGLRRCLAAARAAAGLRASVRPTRRPGQAILAGRDRARLGGDDNQTRFIVDVSRTSTCAPSRSPIPIAWSSTCRRSLPAAGQDRRERPRPDQGVPLRPGDARRLAHRDRHQGPVRIDKAFVLDAVDGQPARLVLDLAAIDRETFMRTLGARKPAGAPAGARRSPTATRRQARRPRPVVVLDPGHGGIDNGTRPRRAARCEKTDRARFRPAAARQAGEDPASTGW